MPLPLLVDYNLGETPVSFLSRLAMRNGVNATDLATDLELSIRSIVDGDPDSIMRLAEQGNADPEELAASSYRKLGIRDYVRNGIPLPRHLVKSPEVRACTGCLRDDARHAGKLTQIGMAMRADWQLPFLRTCAVHGLPLTLLWTDRNAATRVDFATLMGLVFIPVMTGELDPQPRPHSEFEDWIVHRINHGDRNYWFDRNDFYATATFCELLGRAVMLDWFPKSARMDEDRWHEAGKIGFDVCQRGEAFVRGMLVEIQKRDGSPQDGPTARFGPLHDRFSRDMDGPEFEPYISILREHIFKTWPLGPEETVLGVPVGKRRLHSVRTASNETGIGTARLRKAFAAAGLVEPNGENISDAWDIFDAELVAPILAAIMRSMGPTEIQEHYNFPKDQFELMEAAGYFTPIPSGQGTRPAYDPSDIQQFIKHLLKGASPMRQAPQGCCDIPTAARKLDCSATEIARLLHGGHLTRVGRHATRPGYLGIIVDLKELRPLIQTDTVVGHTLAQVGDQLGLRLQHVRMLVDAGLLKAVLGRNPIKRAPQLYVTDTAFSEFNTSYVGLKSISLGLGESRAATTKALIAAKVFPLGGAVRPYGPLYRRDIVAKRFLAPWPKVEEWPGSVLFLLHD